MAVNNNREELLRAFGAYQYKDITRDKEKAVRLLENTEKPAEIKDDNNLTLLHWAARYGWDDVCRQLVEIYKLDPHAKDTYGYTALHWACNNDCADVVHYLVNDAGCDPLLKDVLGNTPFDESKGELKDFLQDIIENRKHFLEAMGECEEEITQLNVMLHGPPGVGKTSLSRVILGEKPLPKEERNSTDIMKNPVRLMKADQLSEFEGQFEKISEEKLIHLIAEFLKKRMKPQDKIRPRHETPPRDTTKPKQPIPVNSTSTVEALKAVNDALSSAQPSSKMFSSKWLNLIDSGGQPQFQDMLPLLFRSPSFQIVLMRLTERLEDKPKMCFTVGGENIVCAPDDLHLTNLQYIERACQIAAAANPPSKVMIVGTHKDELEKDDDTTLPALEKGLKHVYEKYGHVIYSNKDNLIFPMNTLAEDEDERKGYTTMMQVAIAKVTDELAKPQPIPLRWFVFQLALRSQASAVIRKDTCLKLGKLLGMGKDAVEKALIFFNQSAFLLYYPDAIADLVLTKVDPIIGRLSQIVTATFQAPPQLDGCLELRTRLGKKGLFDTAFCDKLFKGADFTDGLTNQEFLTLLVALRLAALVDDKKQLYFLPSALSYLSPTESAFAKDRLACGFILKDCEENAHILPQSFYFTSVVELLSNKNHYQFEISDCSQYRNRIQIYDKSCNIPGVVILSDRTWWMQVSVPIADCCPSISKAVREALYLAKERLQRTVVVSITKVFPCPVKGHSNHYCTVTTNNKYYTCSSDRSECEAVTADMKHWMEGSLLDHSNQLTTINMFNLLQDKSAQWSDIGRAFDVSRNDRESLRRDPALTDNDRLEAVLYKWLQTSPSASWAQFHKILTADLLKFNDVAKRVNVLYYNNF